MVDNILNINKNSEIYLAQEVQDEKYEILFGDGLFGKNLKTNQQSLQNTLLLMVLMEMVLLILVFKEHLQKVMEHCLHHQIILT